MTTLKYILWQHAKEYVLTTSPVGAISDDVAVVLHRLGTSLWTTTTCFINLLYYILLIVLKLAILTFPHAVKLWKRVYDFHRTQLTKTDIMIEVSVLTLLLLFLIFRRRIMRTWRAIEEYISVKSRAAARAAPHVLFFSSSLALAVAGKRFILPLTSTTAMPIFTLVIPLLNTLRMMSRHSYVESEDKPTDAQKNILVLWVVLGIYHGLVTLASSMPFSARLLAWLPYLKEIVIVILIWVQLSPVFAGIVFSSVISPIMSRLSAYIPTTQAIDNKVQVTSSVMSMLKMMRVLNDGHIEFINALLTDALVTVMAVLFIFLPAPFSNMGMVTIALLLPAFRTESLVDSIAQRLTPTGRRAAGEAADRSIRLLYDHWIHYWAWLAVLWLVRIYVFKPWTSVTILLMLWMQHSYFRGSLKLKRFLRETVCMLRERHDVIEQQRRLEAGERRGILEGDRIETEDASVGADAEPVPLTREENDHGTHAEAEVDSLVPVAEVLPSNESLDVDASGEKSASTDEEYIRVEALEENPSTAGLLSARKRNRRK